MLRVIVRIDDAGMATNVGGSVETIYRTFDIEAPEVERLLLEPKHDFLHRQIVGVELKV